MKWIRYPPLHGPMEMVRYTEERIKWTQKKKKKKDGKNERRKKKKHTVEIIAMGI